MQQATIGVMVDYKTNQDFIFTSKPYSENRENITELKKEIEGYDGTTDEDDILILDFLSIQLEELIKKEEFSEKNKIIFNPFFQGNHLVAKYFIRKLEQFIRHAGTILCEIIGNIELTKKEKIELQIVFDFKNFHFLQDKNFKVFAFYFPVLASYFFSPDFDEQYIKAAMNTEIEMVQKMSTFIQEAFNANDKLCELGLFEEAVGGVFEVYSSAKLITHFEPLEKYVVVSGNAYDRKDNNFYGSRSEEL